MKKLFIFALMMMLSMSDMALGKVNPDQAPDEEEAEIGNFDFIYGPQSNQNEAFERTEMLMSEAFSHLGTRYRSGAKGPSAFDCSGFTSYVYKQMTDVFIGASSRDQYARNTPITRAELQCGDLVFFTSPRSGHHVGHVGIVVDVDPVTQNFTFIHASTNSGVVINNSTDSGYAHRYVGARRVKRC
jgi:cell wall-associated NlpC family hydrolase